MITFKEIGIEAPILKAIGELGFVNPTPVQEKVIQHLLENPFDDVIALAQTGTGKTAAFGLPLIQNMNPNSKKIQYLVLCPTRELCLQVAGDLENYAKYLPKIKVTAVYGGASIETQINRLKKGVQIVSATPGRLLDLIRRGCINLGSVQTVVLDEADEMLNMGFRDELDGILAETPTTKNTLLFSATMLPEVRAIAGEFMQEPIEISIGKKNIGAENVSHIAYIVHARDRYLALKRIADYNPSIYGIVFCRTRRETQEVADKLMKDGYNADAIHGDLSQAQRDTVMRKFRNGNLNMLVATDVAARGLDVDDLTHVINYNLPDELEVYTHRSGRTGRAGKTGISIAIANMREKQKLRIIEKQINKKFDHQPVPGGNEICERQLLALMDRIKNVEVDHKRIDKFLPAIYEKLESLEMEEFIKKVVSIEFNRFLDYYKNAPDLNVNVRKSREKQSRSERSDSSNVKFTRFFINIGKADHIKPQIIIGMINDFTNVRNIEIGRIDIQRTISFFEADSGYAELIMDSFNTPENKKNGLVVEIARSDRNPSSIRTKYDRGRPQDDRNRGRSSSRPYRGKNSRKRR